MTHRTEALANLRLAEHDPSPDRLLLAAQVEALLEIAEQLRVANLIALFLADGTDRGIDEFAVEAWDHMADAEVRQVLGLDQ